MLALGCTTFTLYALVTLWSTRSTACRRNQQAAQQLLEQGGGEVVFEGDPASLSDVDSVAQAMLAAMGVSEVRSLLMHIAYEA